MRVGALRVPLCFPAPAKIAGRGVRGAEKRYNAAMKCRWTLVALAAALITPAAGCSFSQSSKSISNSISKSSDSISTSSGSISGSSSDSSKGGESKFRDDVADYTTGWVRSGGGDGGFLDGVGDLAREHGISDWESKEATWEAIGRGLGRTAMKRAEFEGYKQSWGGGQPDRMKGIQSGFNEMR